MSCCRPENPSTPRTARCPRNGFPYAAVSRRTVLHHLKQSWRQKLSEQGYYFCTDPHCDVVYFGEDQQMLERSAIRGEVGQKSLQPQRTICYCFDLSWQDMLAHPGSKDFVVAQTKAASCACEVRNPSGRCCLKDFP